MPNPASVCLLLALNLLPELGTQGHFQTVMLNEHLREGREREKEGTGKDEEEGRERWGMRNLWSFCGQDAFGVAIVEVSCM